MPCNDLRIRGTLKCTAGYFADNIDVYLFSNASNTSITKFSSNFIAASEGESIDFEIKAWYLDYDPDLQYRMRAYSGRTSISSATSYFRMGYPELTFKEEPYDHQNPVNYVSMTGPDSWWANTVELIDGNAFVAPYSFGANELSYIRTFADTDWQPLYVPYDMKYVDFAEYADVAAFSKISGSADAPVIEWNTIHGGTLKPNTPYLIRAKEEGKVTFVTDNCDILSSETTQMVCQQEGSDNIYTFCGVYSPVNTLVGENAYYMVGSDMIRINDSATTVDPYRYYIKAPAVLDFNHPAITMTVDGNIVGGINDVIYDSVKDNGVYYDLLGRPVANPSQGIYIVNGKKVYVK